MCNTEPLSALSLDERWRRLQEEVLVLMVGDGKIDEEERLLLESACYLYLGADPKADFEVGEEEWMDIASRALQYGEATARYYQLFANLGRRVVELKGEAAAGDPARGAIPDEHRDYLVAWAVRCVSGEPSGGRTPESRSFAVRIAESFESWKSTPRPPRLAMHVPQNKPDESRAAGQVSAQALSEEGEQGLNGATTSDQNIPTAPSSDQVNTPVQDSAGLTSAPTSAEAPFAASLSTAPTSAEALAAIPQSAPGARLTSDVSGADLANLKAPSAESVLIDEVDLGRRLRHQMQNDPHAYVLEAVAPDPARFFKEHAAFAKESTGLVWFIGTVSGEVWFAGDVHGDLLAFEAVCDVFERNSGPEDKLLFLGDLVDRGFHNRAVILALWARMQASPGRFGWIVGNHDIAVSFDKASGRFKASVAPAEFTEWLNANLEDAPTRALGEAFAAMAAEAPRAIFLPGLLAAHGGFPHSDRWAALHTRQDLESPPNLDDFVWNRLHASRMKLPNRHSKTSSYGADDFRGFQGVMRDKLQWPVDTMVRGHDHVSDSQARWHRPNEVTRGSFGERVLTINTLSHNLPGEFSPYMPANPRQPTLARWRSGSLPAPIVVDIPPRLVEEYANPCPECQRPRWEGACDYCTGRALRAPS